MKKVQLIILSVSLFWGYSCASPKQTAEETQMVVSRLLSQPNYKIELTQAFPQSGEFSRMALKLNLFQGGSSASSINLSGYSAFIRVKNDTVIGRLPFFGERYSGNSNRPNNGIRFKGVPKKYSQSRIDNHYECQFTIRDQDYSTEFYELSITVYGNSKTTVSVTSSQRSTMRYTGIMTIKDQREGK